MLLTVQGLTADHDLDVTPSKLDAVALGALLAREQASVDDSDIVALAEAQHNARAAWLMRVGVPAEVVDDLHPYTIIALVDRLSGAPDGRLLGKSAITLRS